MLMEKKKISNLKSILLAVTVVLLFLCIDYTAPGLKDVIFIALVGFNLLLFLANKLKK